MHGHQHLYPARRRCQLFQLSPISNQMLERRLTGRSLQTSYCIVRVWQGRELGSELVSVSESLEKSMYGWVVCSASLRLAGAWSTDSCTARSAGGCCSGTSHHGLVMASVGICRGKPWRLGADGTLLSAYGKCAFVDSTAVQVYFATIFHLSMPKAWHPSESLTCCKDAHARALRRADEEAAPRSSDACLFLSMLQKRPACLAQ